RPPQAGRHRTPNAGPRQPMRAPARPEVWRMARASRPTTRCWQRQAETRSRSSAAGQAARRPRSRATGSAAQAPPPPCRARWEEIQEGSSRWQIGHFPLLIYRFGARRSFAPMHRFLATPADIFELCIDPRIFVTDRIHIGGVVGFRGRNRARSRLRRGRRKGSNRRVGLVIAGEPQGGVRDRFAVPRLGIRGLAQRSHRDERSNESHFSPFSGPAIYVDQIAEDSRYAAI